MHTLVFKSNPRSHEHTVNSMQYLFAPTDIFEIFGYQRTLFLSFPDASLLMVLSRSIWQVISRGLTTLSVFQVYQFVDHNGYTSQFCTKIWMSFIITGFFFAVSFATDTTLSTPATAIAPVASQTSAPFRRLLLLKLWKRIMAPLSMHLSVGKIGQEFSAATEWYHIEYGVFFRANRKSRIVLSEQFSSFL